MEGTEEVNNQLAVGTAAGSECYLDLLIMTSEGWKKIMQKLEVEVNLETFSLPNNKNVSYKN